MNHKLIIAAASAFVYVRNEMNSMDDIFMANVEALVQNEGTAVKVCYMNSPEGVWGSAIFCNYNTSSSMLYPCPAGESNGHKGAVSYCTR